MAWYDSALDAFDKVVKVGTEAYKEVVTADNSTANPQTHEQPVTAVQPTGQVAAAVSASGGANSWLASNWMLIVVVLLAALALFALIKWV